MSDLEQRLSEVLHRGAEAAPDATGLAGAARTRARQRRRTRLAGAAAVVALAVAAPTAWVLGTGGDPDRSVDPQRTAADPGAGDEGFRWESWHGVTVQVPDTWAPGALSTWCLTADEPVPHVQRPGGATAAIACSPQQTYGLSFQEVDAGADFAWPVVHQAGGGWPEENVVGGRGIGGVLITVATREETLAQRILDSAHAIGPDGDPNGCTSRLGGDPVAAPEGALSVCRYDDTGLLEQSEALVGQPAGDAVRALQAAPPAGAEGCTDASSASQPHGVVLLRAAGTSARVDLVPDCARVTVDGDVRTLTSDVLYWALSPGWSGDATGLPLPAQLRQQ
ncbi:hypothetical protein G5V58_02380 [Nocardioides anomalus]|uniref:Uncharacterized protein n=1 Tax=Nocardioides anomalus TaxID=2712223 RepID=A0A6G6W9F1_9ACTN|nr:hypothetical protein [Nocardioides anomalus]QIG41777.1 hypothetical protein G5V58_02380 [Nocardioides anomalus]